MIIYIAGSCIPGEGWLLGKWTPAQNLPLTLPGNSILQVVEEICKYFGWLEECLRRAGTPPTLSTPQDQVPESVGPLGGDGDPVVLLKFNDIHAWQLMRKEIFFFFQNPLVPGASAASTAEVVPYMLSVSTDMVVSESRLSQLQILGCVIKFQSSPAFCWVWEFVLA